MLNEKTRAVYEYIKQRMEETGVPPTMKEICDDLGLGSTSTAHRYVEILIDLGLAEKDGGSKNRTIRLTGISSGRIIPVVISQWYQWPGHPRYYASRIFDIELE